MGGHARSPWGCFSAKFMRAGRKDKSKRVNAPKSTIKLHFWRRPADRTEKRQAVSEEGLRPPRRHVDEGGAGSDNNLLPRRVYREISMPSANEIRQQFIDFFVK